MNTSSSRLTPPWRTRLTFVNVILLLVVVSMIGFLAAPYLTNRQSPPPPDTPPEVPGASDYIVVNTYPHDPDAFTQGLSYHEGFLYEGTGQYKSSSIRKTNLETGEVLQIVPLDDSLFGEGIAIRGDEIIQLTWLSGFGFIRDLETFKVLSEFKYEGQGWGLAYDGSRFIMSDGSSTLRMLDPETLAVIDTLTVTDRDIPVRNINELEIVGEELLANIWESDRIARISLDTGRVTGWIDLGGLRLEARRRARPNRPIDVLNGIAYDAKGDRLFVTGKYWPVLFEIKLTNP